MDVHMGRLESKTLHPGTIWKNLVSPTSLCTSVLQEKETHPLIQPTSPSVVYVFCSILGFVFVDKISLPARYVVKNELCTLVPLPSKPCAADVPSFNSVFQF